MRHGVRAHLNGIEEKSVERSSMMIGRRAGLWLLRQRAALRRSFRFTLLYFVPLTLRLRSPLK